MRSHNGYAVREMDRRMGFEIWVGLARSATDLCSTDQFYGCKMDHENLRSEILILILWRKCCPRNKNLVAELTTKCPSKFRFPWSTLRWFYGPRIKSTVVNLTAKLLYSANSPTNSTMHCTFPKFILQPSNTFAYFGTIIP